MRSLKTKTIIITGGGTGGHVFPALCLAESFQKKNVPVKYVGSDRGLEAKLAPEKKIPFFVIQSGPIKNQKLTQIIKSLFLLLKGFLWSWNFLGQEKPAAVIGVGGYVSVPVCLTAWVRRIPVFLQEQNTSVGLANRLLGKISTRVFLGFPQAESYFPENRCTVTGNPLRSDFYEKGFKALPLEPKVLLILGGSQGAASINKAITSFLPELKSFSIIHQTGKKDFPWVKELYKNFSGKYEVLEFIDDIHKIYNESTLILSRSGAMTVSELMVCGRPAILVPYPRVGQNDQLTNAYFFKSMGLGTVVEQGESFERRLLSSIKECSEPEKLLAFHKGFSALPKRNAVDTIITAILREAHV
jgi:UDP-N-acetylglucosamine--N-acetylmuramyl-(pentapeptide) pyrophosphoryl-undecaprenol N-acetylglucosamine transferase